MGQEIILSEAKMTSTAMDSNAETLAREIIWFVSVVNERLQDYFPKENIAIPPEKERSWINKILNRTAEKEVEKRIQEGSKIQGLDKLVLPDLANDHSVYAEFVNYYKLNVDERLLLILTIIPHVQPHLLDVFFSMNKALGRGYTEFGGIKGNRHSGFIPTIETVLFLLAGNDLSYRFRVYRLFEPDHIFLAHNIISLEQGQSNEPFYSSSIFISDEYIDFFTTGKIRKPQFSMEFPAKSLTTKMNWEDLVVDDYTAQQLDELRIWLKYGHTLYNEWGMDKKLKPGYKVLFHGPPGTGKTLTAALLGKLYGLDVYRIDLSMVISKFIGETEKNLEKVFRKAENKNWILFFDEADALFGKRTDISDAHDKYANQEIAYLLQRLEDYPGLVILASNMRDNVDAAFTRRIQSIIHFPKPQPKERMRLWSKAFSQVCTPPGQEELIKVAQQYDLSGGSIMNIVQFASLQALSREDKIITYDDMLQGIKKELKKEGKTL
jgi:hypothetical protein